MKVKLTSLLPSVRWTPHDIDDAQSLSSSHQKPRSPFVLLAEKTKTSVKWRISSEPHHGAPRRRKSTLSLNSEADEELERRTALQGQSLFFSKLPIEIRKTIYEEVMGSETVHLTLASKKKISHFLCPRGGEESGLENMSEHKHDLGKIEDCDCKVLIGGGHNRRLSRACVNILRTCRRMYSEAVPHLYRPRILSLLHITHLLYLPSRIPQPRLNNIRTLHLRYSIRTLPYYRRSSSQSSQLVYPEDTSNWEKAWNILGSMKGLMDLRVVIIDVSKGGIWEAQWLNLEEQLLESVHKVKNVRKVAVVLPYDSCGVDWDIGSGVVLKRPASQGADTEDL